MAQQGSRPPRSSRLPTAGHSRDSWRARGETADTDDQDPPWAGPGIAPRWAGREAGGRRRPGRSGSDGDAGADAGGGRLPLSRAALARARRTRRTRVLWGGALAVVLAVAAGVGAVITLGHHTARSISDGLVTTFQPGEFRTVPKACSAVTGTTLGQYLPGKRHTVVPHSLFGSAESLCDWSVDAPPMYRLLEVTIQAYAPTGLASGNGSATAAATDAYRQAVRQKVDPPRKSHLPKARLTQVHGLGDTAFAALQVPSAGGDTTDLVTVVARDHNVLITVVFDGLAHSGNGRYGPVSAATLQAGAVAAARDVLARLH